MPPLLTHPAALFALILPLIISLIISLKTRALFWRWLALLLGAITCWQLFIIAGKASLLAPDSAPSSSNEENPFLYHSLKSYGLLLGLLLTGFYLFLISAFRRITQRIQDQF